MSQEQAEAKRKEIEAIENIDKELEEAAGKDKCTNCGMLVAEMPYLSGIPNLGWIECTRCGQVFCPQMIRKLKLADRLRKETIESPQLLVPGK